MHCMHYTVTYNGLLYCLSLYLTPIQADDGPNTPHSSSTGVKSVELEI